MTQNSFHCSINSGQNLQPLLWGCFEFGWLGVTEVTVIKYYCLCKPLWWQSSEHPKSVLHKFNCRRKVILFREGLISIIKYTFTTNHVCNRVLDKSCGRHIPKARGANYRPRPKCQLQKSPCTWPHQVRQTNALGESLLQKTVGKVHIAKPHQSAFWSCLSQN